MLHVGRLCNFGLLHRVGMPKSVPKSQGKTASICKLPHNNIARWWPWAMAMSMLYSNNHANMPSLHILCHVLWYVCCSNQYTGMVRGCNVVWPDFWLARSLRSTHSVITSKKIIKVHFLHWLVGPSSVLLVHGQASKSNYESNHNQANQSAS